MIASLRGLVALAVLTFVLAVVLMVDMVRPHARNDRRLIREDVSFVQRLTWPGLVVQRAGDRWQSVNLTGNPGQEAGIVMLDTAAINDVLRTLDAARWHRRGGTPGTVHTSLDVDGTKIEIADELPGTDQTWVIVDGAPLLVDRWVAHALAPGALALHVRHPFAEAARSEAITFFGTGPNLKLTGHPRRHAHGRFAPVDATHALEQALADVEVVGLGTSAPSGPDFSGLQVSFDTAIERVGGTCPALTDLVAIHGIYGDECITQAAWDRVLEAARAIDDKVELRPVLGDPATATLADGTVVDLRSDAASALVHALTTPASENQPPGALPEITHLVVATRAGEKYELRVRPNDVVERMADGAALHIAHADWLALQAPAAIYADPTRWSEDPTAVATISVGGVTYHRGAVLGEWTPAGPLDAKALNALAAGLANVRARDAAPAPTAHTGAPPTMPTITVTLAPPIGAPVTHALALGKACAGRIDGTPVIFEPPTCKTLETVSH